MNDAAEIRSGRGDSDDRRADYASYCDSHRCSDENFYSGIAKLAPRTDFESCHAWRPLRDFGDHSASYRTSNWHRCSEHHVHDFWDGDSKDSVQNETASAR